MQITHTVIGEKASLACDHAANGGAFRLRGYRFACVSHELSLECSGGDRVVRSIRNEDLKIVDPAAYNGEIELAKSRTRYVKKATLELVLIA